MTCKEALHAWREKTAGQAPHARVYFFHAHIYYDSARQEEKLKMHTIIKEMQDEFAADDHVGVHTLQVSPLTRALTISPQSNHPDMISQTILLLRIWMQERCTAPHHCQPGA